MIFTGTYRYSRGPLTTKAGPLGLGLGLIIPIYTSFIIIVVIIVWSLVIIDPGNNDMESIFTGR
jgi:uncharacterized membrane protein